MDQATHNNIVSFNWIIAERVDQCGTQVDEFGDDLFGNFDQVAVARETRLAECRADDDDDGAGAKKGLLEKWRKELLDAKTWGRDGRLVEVATKLRLALGDGIFEDSKVFRHRLDGALKDAGTKVPAAELKRILKAVSWRVENAPSAITKALKPGKLTAETILACMAP